jgi:hypothetical protein
MIPILRPTSPLSGAPLPVHPLQRMVGVSVIA